MTISKEDIFNALTSQNIRCLSAYNGPRTDLYMMCDKGHQFSVKQAQTAFKRAEKGICKECRKKEKNAYKVELGKRKYLEKRSDSSKYIGVCKQKYKSGRDMWKAHIKHKGKKIHIGMYKTEEEAAKAYDKKALELRGNEAVLNFPDTRK